MKRIISILSGIIISSAIIAQTNCKLTVSNPNRSDLLHDGVTVDLRDIGKPVKSVYLTDGGTEVPYQLDDIDGDGIYDELFFFTDIKKKGNKVLDLVIYDYGHPRKYEAKAYAEMMLTNKKIKESNKQDLYISQLTVDRGVNPYWMLHHHGCAFENEMVAYRIYFDQRQTVDIYGKYHKGLELKATQFYPDESQKTSGYGDDVLWVGNTLGLGTLRGWADHAPTMIADVEHRTQRVIARGPLRTIVEVIDTDWRPTPNAQPVTMTTRYTLESGRRDCRVDVSYSRDAHDLSLCTGIINIKGSEEYSDHNGLRGCWGTDWPVSAKDSVGHKRETVGLGIRVPTENLVSELPADASNYPLVIKVPAKTLTYHITFGSANEDFGYHTSNEWFAYLKEWGKRLELRPAVVVLEGAD